MTPALSDKGAESLLQPIMLDISDTPIPPKRMRRDTVKKLYRLVFSESSHYFPII